jgi:hypothetical protein
MRCAIFDGEYKFTRSIGRTPQRAMNRNGTIRLAVIAMPNHVGNRLFEAKVDSEAQLCRKTMLSGQRLYPGRYLSQVGEPAAQPQLGFCRVCR